MPSFSRAVSQINIPIHTLGVEELLDYATNRNELQEMGSYLTWDTTLQCQIQHFAHIGDTITEINRTVGCLQEQAREQCYAAEVLLKNMHKADLENHLTYYLVEK